MLFVLFCILRNTHFWPFCCVNCGGKNLICCTSFTQIDGIMCCWDNIRKRNNFAACQSPISASTFPVPLKPASCQMNGNNHPYRQLKVALSQQLAIIQKNLTYATNRSRGSITNCAHTIASGAGPVEQMQSSFLLRQAARCLPPPFER